MSILKTRPFNVLLQDVLAGFKWAESDENIRIIITTGEGRFYTAGMFAPLLNFISFWKACLSMIKESHHR